MLLKSQPVVYRLQRHSRRRGCTENVWPEPLRARRWPAADMVHLQNLPKWDTDGRDLGRIWNGWKRLLDPRPRYVLIPLWHPPGDKKGWFV